MRRGFKKRIDHTDPETWMISAVSNIIRIAWARVGCAEIERLVCYIANRWGNERLKEKLRA